MTIRRWILAGLTFVVSQLSADQDFVFAATRVDLVIDEPFADRKAAWPITTGVPFPRGKLTSAEHCRLINDRGQERPLQARVAATWEVERKSVRGLTIGCVDGFYTGPGGERIAKYRTRYHFFAGLPLVKAIDELSFVGSTKQTRFADIGFALDLNVKTSDRTVSVDASGEAGKRLPPREPPSILQGWRERQGFRAPPSFVTSPSGQREPRNSSRVLVHDSSDWWWGRLRANS